MILLLGYIGWSSPLLLHLFLSLLNLDVSMDHLLLLLRITFLAMKKERMNK